MHNTFSLEQISETGNLDSNLILRQYKLDPMARFMEIKSVNTKLKQNQIAKELGYSNSTLQRNRNDTKMLSLYRIPLNNTNKRRQKISKKNLDHNSKHEHDHKIPQMTSDDLKRPHLTSKDSPSIIETVKPKRSKLKGGANIEINENYVD